MIGSVIFDLLSKTAALTAVVPAAKITPVKRLQASLLPAITYQVVDCIPTDTKDGVSKLDRRRVSVNCWSLTYTQASTLAALVRSALDRYTGTNSTVMVDKIIFDNLIELYEDEPQVYHHIVDFIVRIKN